MSIRGSYTKNCFFEDFDISFTAKLDSVIEQNSKGYFIKIRIPPNQVSKLMKYGIYPNRKDVDYWVLTIKINNRTSIMLNGRKVDWYKTSTFDDIPLDRLVINGLILRKYSTRVQEEYQCSCYAKRLVLHERIK